MTVTIVDHDDWKGLYIDGCLVWQGASVDLLEVLTLVVEDPRNGFRHSVGGWVLNADEVAHLEDVGALPKTLEELETARWIPAQSRTRP